MSRTIRNKNPRWWSDDNERAHRDGHTGGPPSWFKKMKQRQRRAKIKNALYNIEDENVEVPKFRKSDRWDWF